MNVMAQGCHFEVTDADPSISGTKVTITVTVVPTFKPNDDGDYEVVIKPQGQLRNILDSQSKSVVFEYYDWAWHPAEEEVEFYCRVDDNTYNECNSNSFEVSTCFKKP